MGNWQPGSGTSPCHHCHRTFWACAYRLITRVTLSAQGLLMKGNRGCTNSFNILIHGTVPCMGQALCKCRRNRICLIAVVRAGSDSLLKARCAHPASLIRLMQPTPLTFISRWENYLHYRSRDRQPPPGTRTGTTLSFVEKVRSTQLDPGGNLPL